MAMPTSEIGEVFTYPKETLRPYGFQAVRQVRVTWADRYNWSSYFLYTSAANLYPYFVAEGITPQSNIIRIGIEPDKTKLTYGASEAQAVYTHAVLTLVYQSSGYDGDNVIVEELVPWTETVYAMVGQTYWSDGSPTGSNSVAINLPGYTYYIHYPRRHTLPTIVSWNGVINMDAYLCKMFPLYIYPYRGLYCGAELKASFSYDGIQNLSVRHEVRVRAFNWNQEWNPLTAAPDFVYDENGVQLQKHASTIFTGLL